MKNLIIAVAVFITIASCNDTENNNNALNTDSKFEKIDSTEAIYNDEEYLEAKELQKKVPLFVTPDLETEAMKSPKSDVADDPAIWINPADAAKSTIIGTDKYDGLHVYDLDGKELFYYTIGKTNNVDVRYGFPLGNEKIDIVACSNRGYNGISLLKVNPADGSLEDIAARKLEIDTNIVDDIYGFCMYKSPKTKKYYVIANGKNGLVQQYELVATKNNKIDFKLVRELQIPSQPEGMVADDEKGILYVGEEAVGVWKFGAEPEDDKKGQLIFNAEDVDVAVPDIEGISLYYAEGGKGYLIVSSQGNFTYIIIDRETDKYITSFKITDSQIDGIEETDGLDVLNLPLGTKFPNGIFVAQDGFNHDNKKISNQNFKIVSWDKIAKMATPNLIIDNQYDFRK